MAHTGSYNIGVPGPAVIIPDQSHVINGDGGLLAYVIYASQAGFAEVQLWRPTGGTRPVPVYVLPGCGPEHWIQLREPASYF